MAPRLMRHEDIIVEMVFGSHLYGTDTPDSDRDYKGVFFPNIREVLLGHIPKQFQDSTKGSQVDSKNTRFDTDREWYSLQYFVDLGIAGETCILDMLHAPREMWLESSDTWEWIVAHRDRFYRKSLAALIGYARRQAAKYGIKGSRVNDLRAVIDALRKVGNKDEKLQIIWDYLPEGEHLHKVPSEDERFMFYQVAGRKFLETVKIQDVYDACCEIYCKYGKRADAAARNEGIDWKALSHAIRAAMEVIEIFECKTISFPLREAEYIKQVKMGQRDYLPDVAPRLEGLMERAEELKKISDLPETVDCGFWEDFVVSAMLAHFRQDGRFES